MANIVFDINNNNAKNVVNLFVREYGRGYVENNLGQLQTWAYVYEQESLEFNKYWKQEQISLKLRSDGSTDILSKIPVNFNRNLESEYQPLNLDSQQEMHTVYNSYFFKHVGMLFQNHLSLPGDAILGMDTIDVNLELYFTENYANLLLSGKEQGV
jgi:hypothetical protein